jgi:hypothetical protein
VTRVHRRYSVRSVRPRERRDGVTDGFARVSAPARGGLGVARPLRTRSTDLAEPVAYLIVPNYRQGHGRRWFALVGRMVTRAPERCCTAVLLYSCAVVRHEALCDRVEVKGLHRLTVAAVGWS